jgi:hypothetical protein
VAEEMFHEPGKATARAVAIIRELLAAPMRRTQPVRSPVDAQPVGGGVS